ncbi:hypothetical protein DMC30DRAFT_393057 [Rhodotorula diobovata]|uniref:Uncharacterized protein n=1 Tax=Rhodotorula diobovata TaxID=5288 RepID=A0A5C5FZ43_9BASI|nr:hypothetical protein DMC30DRAFT_393057 [Rhodotorula diobovata]
MADWSDKLAVHKGWYTFPRLHAAANGSRQFNVQVDLSEVMRCAGAPSSIFARGRRQPKVPIMTAPHLLIHGLWTMAVAHKERAERATARNDEVAAQHDEVMAHELFALVLLSQLCKTHGGVPRLYGTDEAWLACIRHPEHRGGYSAAKLFVEEELQPGSAIVQHLYQTFSGHVSEHVLEEALTWITQRFKHEIEVLPAGHIPSPHRSRSQSRSPHHAGRASAHSLGHASSRYFPQDRRLASSSRF